MRVSKIALFVSCSLFCVTAYPASVTNAAQQAEPRAARAPLQESGAPIAQGLTDFQWFRVFPYVDKSYTLAAAGRLDEALVEVERARQIVPDHLPLLLHQVELLIENGNPQRAFEVLQPYLADPRARRAYTSLLGRSERLAGLSEVQFFAELERLDADEQAAFASGYLDTHGNSMNKAQLVRLSEILSPEQLNAELSAQIAEYLFRQDGAAEVVNLLEPLCQDAPGRAGHCSDRQRSQLIQALVMSEQFDGIEQWLMPLADEDFDNMLDATANRMIGAERHAELIELLSSIDDQRSLNQEWGLALYRLAVDEGEVQLALNLAERYPVNCLSHTELLIEDQQMQSANDRLGQCRPAAHEESRYLVLAQRVGEPALLERQHMTSAEAERTRVSLLMDHYTANNQRQALIRLLQGYEHRDLDMQQRLAQAYYESGQTSQALALSARGWHQGRDVASLDYHTYILLNEQRHNELLRLAINETWDVKRTELANSDIGDRLSIGIEQAHAGTESDALVRAARRWPDRRVAAQVSEVLIQRQDCSAAKVVRRQLDGVAGHHIDSYCLDTPAERLVALEQYRDQWGDDEWLRGAVLAYDSGNYSKSMDYLGNLSASIERSVYKPLELSVLLALGQEDEAWARWRGLSEPLTEDEMLIGVEIALRRDDRQSVTTALERVQGSEYRRTALPLRLRLAEMDGDLEQQLSLFESLAADNPDDPYYLLAQAFVQERLGRYKDAGHTFDLAFETYPNTRNQNNLQQAAYVNARARRDRVAKQQLRDVIDTALEDGQQGTETLAHHQRFYRDVASPFSASVAGWVGESTNVSQVTGNDFQADYFLSTMLEYDLDYGRERRSNLSLFANLLSAGDSFFFDSNNLDIGMAWQPFDTHLTFLRVAGRTSFDGGGTRLYLRGSTDLLASYNVQKTWAEGKRVVDHSLYLDWLFFPDEQTSSFYGRYQPTFQFEGAQRSYFKFGAYPFIQYQWTNDTIDQQRLTDTRVGLGITWRQPVGSSRYSGWHAFSEVGLEWQHVVDSEIAGVSDNGLLLRFAVYF